MRPLLPFWSAVLKRLLFPVLALVALSAAACGGGGGTTPVAPATPTPTPHAGPTAVPIPSPSASPAVVLLSGGGYTLQFTIPPITTGSTATMNAVLQTTLPSGVNAPQAHSTLKHMVAVRPLATTFNGLAYLVVSSTADVGFSSAPSFQFTVPAGAIPAGDSTYLLFWDPNVGPLNGWINLLGPGAISGNTVTFPGVQTGVNLLANTQYIYALAVSSQTQPTATPAPTPTPVPSPSSLPAYCNTTYANPSPNPGGAKLYLTDDSGLNVPLIVYITETNTATPLFLDAHQNFTSTSPVPLPAACFSTTLHSSGTVPLVIPNNTAGGHIYLAYAPAQGSTVPNPFSGSTSSGPQEDFGSSPFPWDFVEYGVNSNPALIIDTTQVTALGLPLELSVGTSAPLPVTGPSCGTTALPTIVGVTSCNYAAIFAAMEADPVYKALVIAQDFNGIPYDLRILNPQQSATASSFPWNVFGDQAFLPKPSPSACAGSTSNGYLGCVLASYAQTPRMYTTNRKIVAGTLASGDVYCVSSDGSSNFIMTDVGQTPASTACQGSYTPAPSPTGAPVNPFYMPVQEFTYGLPPAVDTGNMVSGCKDSLLFGTPWGLANVDSSPGQGHVFATQDAFALWKALSGEIIYGTALSTNEHPIGGFANPASLSPPFAPMFADPLYDDYDLILHTNFDNYLAYGLPYDDMFGWATTLHYNNSGSIAIRVNAVPQASATTNPSPVPSATPSSCPTLPNEVGATPAP